MKKWEQDITTRAILEGAVRIFVLQLEKRFGKVPSEISELIKLFDLPQIETWSLQLLDATTVSEAFKGLFNDPLCTPTKLTTQTNRYQTE